MEACASRPDRTGGNSDVGTELELVVQKTLRGVRSGGYEDEVGGLAANLEAEAGAGELDEGRSAPAMAGAARDDNLWPYSPPIAKAAFLKPGITATQVAWVATLSGMPRSGVAMSS